MLVQLLIDSLVELLQLVLRQISISGVKQQTEAQIVFLSGLRGNIISFQMLKKQLENLGGNDDFGGFFVQPKGGELFETKPKSPNDSAFIQGILEKKRAEKEKYLDSELKP
jgi:hypothetical protein